MPYKDPEVGRLHGKAYRHRAEIKQRKKEYDKAYRLRPEVRKRRTQWVHTYRKRAYVRKKRYEDQNRRRQKPEIKEKTKQYNLEYKQRPYAKQRANEVRRNYTIDLLRLRQMELLQTAAKVIQEPEQQPLPKNYYRGYIRITVNSKRGLQHRFIYEQHYKCCLLKWVVVRHINGKNTDNRPENLETMTKWKMGRLSGRNGRLRL